MPLVPNHPSQTILAFNKVYHHCTPQPCYSSAENKRANGTSPASTVYRHVPLPPPTPPPSFLFCNSLLYFPLHLHISFAILSSHRAFRRSLPPFTLPSQFAILAIFLKSLKFCGLCTPLGAALCCLCCPKPFRRRSSHVVHARKKRL